MEQERKNLARKIQISEDPKSKQIKVNLSTSTYEINLIKKIVEKNEWKKTYGFEGDILWTGRKEEF